MLHFFRKHSHSILVRIVLGLIAFSFCFWGATSFFRTKPTPEFAVAYVGEAPISLKNIMDQMNEAGVPAAQRSEVYTDVLHKQIEQHILFNESQRLGMVVPDAMLRQSIRSLPFLHTEKGQFDSAKLQALLSNGVIKKETLLSYAYTLLVGRQLETLFYSRDLYPPTGALSLFQELHAKRDVTIHLFRPFTPNELQSMSTDYLNSQDFKDFIAAQESTARTSFVPGISVPATCTIHAVHISKDYFPTSHISPQELAQALAERFPQREVRQLVRLEGPTAEDVEKAIEALQNRTTPPDTVRLENTAYANDSPSPMQWAEPAAHLASGSHTAITKSESSYVAVYVSSITQEDTKPKDKAIHKQLREELALARQQAEADNLRIQLEAETSLENIHKIAGTRARLFMMEPLTRQGTTLFGLAAKHLYGVPLDKEAMESVFTAAPGQLDTPITLTDGSHVFFVVTENKAASTRTGQHIHMTPLQAKFLKEKMNEASKKKALSVSESLAQKNKHNPKDLGFKIIETLSRSNQSILQSSLSLSLEDRIQVAQLKPNSHTCVFIEGLPCIIHVTSVKAVDPSSDVESYKNFKEWLRQSLSKELKGSWSKMLYKTHSVSIVAPTYNKALEMKKKKEA